MKVKKRTVWFLTLVSLVAVISVFYIFEDNTPNILSIFSDEAINETDILGVNQNLTQPVNSESDLFQEVRLEQANKRSQLKAQLTQKIASDEYSAEEKNTAFNEMDELIKLESSEAMLEMLIKSIGYSDALVRIDDEKVMVTVMSDEISNKQASEIMYIVRSEFNDYVNVQVKFEPFN
ncbi:MULTISPECIES: SpoIIIAH-like family protein [Solibacillus]|uniref:SpoIIIAH-like family protein n=1 Tax=Solibacillus merdavium TaxID=2762218 RepID=A0ABR8XNI0_9BACL|nr:SpoIIIAH-like family protein [Solibacillus merdavium]MBD8033459.1 SpoIIIAH-like family protein [Solibacillus merdavium]